MNTYIFYTTEGYTETPRLEEIENLQILGEAIGENEEQALERLLQETPWIIEKGYEVGEIISKQILDDTLRANIQTVIDYLWVDEERHYEESTIDDECEDHIFLVLKALRNAIK